MHYGNNFKISCKTYNKGGGGGGVKIKSEESAYEMLIYWLMHWEFLLWDFTYFPQWTHEWFVNLVQYSIHIKYKNHFEILESTVYAISTSIWESIDSIYSVYTTRIQK